MRFASLSLFLTRPALVLCLIFIIQMRRRCCCWGFCFAGNICSAKTFRVRAIGSLFVLQLLYFFKYRWLLIHRHSGLRGCGGGALKTSSRQQAMHGTVHVHCKICNNVLDDMTIINATELSNS